MSRKRELTETLPEEVQTMPEELRSPERVLEELIQTGQNWLDSRARERAVGPSPAEGRGSGYHQDQEATDQDSISVETSVLRDRFRTLVGEFIEKIEEP